MVGWVSEELDVDSFSFVNKEFIKDPDVIQLNLVYHEFILVEESQNSKEVAQEDSEENGKDSKQSTKAKETENLAAYLNSSRVSSAGYKSYLEEETIKVFARERTDCFSLRCAAWFNLYGQSERYVVFNVEDINYLNNIYDAVINH